MGVAIEDLADVLFHRCLRLQSWRQARIRGNALVGSMQEELGQILAFAASVSCVHAFTPAVESVGVSKHGAIGLGATGRERRGLALNRMSVRVVGTTVEGGAVKPRSNEVDRVRDLAVPVAVSRILAQRVKVIA